MKKLINQPDRVVEEMTLGLLATHPGLGRLSGYSVLLRLDAEDMRERQVAIISGGGSGHEPAHAGYVGAGMLSAAVAGEVFTSPSTASVLAAIHAVSGAPGVLLIVKNYTGDRLNFGVAAEMARAEGIRVETVMVADDVALAHTEEHAGRRGIAGTVLVHKVAGAAAAEGKSLAEVARIAQSAASEVATMGVSLGACTVPAVGKPSFTLAESEAELGLGIHGEPGVRRIPLQPAEEIAQTLAQSVLSASPFLARSPLAVLINNLGATTTMELAIFAGAALNALQTRGVIIERVYAGTFLSSLDMAGVSLTVMRVDEDRLRWLDAPTSAPAWPNASTRRPTPPADRVFPPRKRATLAQTASATPQVATRMQQAIHAACHALIDAEAALTELDRTVGDGDLGINLARGARTIQSALPLYLFESPAETLTTLGITLQDVLGGSSGPLYGVLLLRAAQSLNTRKPGDPSSWAAACMQGCDAIRELGGAQPGDRTMLDALIPFARVLSTAIEGDSPLNDALRASLRAAEAGAQATAQMVPRRGRSSYLGNRALGHPDPGAVAVTVWLRAVVSAIAG
jgi:dihydroxyacetone kinase